MQRFGHFMSRIDLRLGAVIVFLLIYLVVTFKLAGVQQKTCLTLNDVADHMRRLEQLELELKVGLRQQQQQQLALLQQQRLAEVVTDVVGAGESVTVSRVKGGDVAHEGITAPLGGHNAQSELLNTTSGKRHDKRDRERSSAAKDPMSVFVHDTIPVDQLLNTSYAPNTVYYLWCGRRWFEFPHYLSVLSVIRHLRPDNIIFFYDVAPIVDSWTYNTWYGELAEKYPFFRGYQLHKNEPGCIGHSQPNLTFILDVLRGRGGLYINEMTIITSLPASYRLANIVSALDQATVTGLLMTSRGQPHRGLSLDAALHAEGVTSRTFSCFSLTDFIQLGESVNNVSAGCVVLSDALYPKDIWELDNVFGRLVRTLLYGAPAILRPTPSFDELIPNIAHIVWLGGGQMDFLFYLCVLSLIHVAKVDMVYIHGDGPPRGPYWNLVKQEPKLQLIYREPPVLIYGTPVNVVSHVTDIWRVDFMLRYGGIYVDTDVVFVRPLDRKIRGYDAVGTYDWTYWNHPFPDTINFGVAIGKRNAPYWHKFQESMKWFKDDDWAWNGLRQPYRILERNPDLVLIDPRLQVTCYLSLCHPTWWPDYHNESVHHLNSPSIKDWQKDVYSFHWTLPTPYELLNHTTLLTTKTMFSEIGQYVLKEAGVLEYFKNVVNERRKL